MNGSIDQQRQNMQRARQNPAGRRRASPPMSRESKFIGYLVLGLGVLAVISVLIFAFSGGNVDTSGETDQQVAESLQKDMAAPAKMAKLKPAAPKPELVMPRQKGIDASDLTGSWKSSLGDYVAVMQMDKGAFQIILAPMNHDLPRMYSSGSFTMIDDIAVLTPRSDWKAPPPPPGQDVEYERLTRGEYSMIVGFKDGAMVWQNIPESEKRVSAPPRSPLLLDPALDYIVWKKLD